MHFNLLRKKQSSNDSFFLTRFPCFSHVFRQFLSDAGISPWLPVRPEYAAPTY